MLAPQPQSSHLLPSRLLWQMLAPPHSSQLLLSGSWWQMLAPPHSFQHLMRRWCWQILLSTGTRMLSCVSRSFLWRLLVLSLPSAAAHFSSCLCGFLSTVAALQLMGSSIVYLTQVQPTLATAHFRLAPGSPAFSGITGSQWQPSVQQLHTNSTM